MKLRKTQTQPRESKSKVSELLTQPWALTEESFKQISNSLTQLQHDPAALGFMDENEDPEEGLDIRRGGVAVIPIAGVLRRRAGFFSFLFGDRSYEGIQRQLEAALDSNQVNAIVFDVDSPGGQVNGVADLAQTIFDARGTKPILSVVTGDATSAAYYLASSAETVFASRTSLLGSIGVRMVFLDFTEFDKQFGIKEISIVSSQSPDKDIDPASEDGRDKIQATVDQLAGVFVEDVMRNRGVSEEVILENFGRGWVVVGESAVDAGMADGIATLESVLEDLAEGRQVSFATPAERGTITGVGMKPTIELSAISVEWLAEHLPAVAASLREQGSKAAGTATAEALAAAMAEGRVEGVTEGVATENARILAIEGASIEGQEELVETLKADTAVSAGDAALQINAAHKASGEEGGAAYLAAAAEAEAKLKKDGPKAGTPEDELDDNAAASVKAAGDYVEKMGAIH